MLLTQILPAMSSKFLLLISEFNMLNVLIIVGIFFLILIILGIRKTYKLNKENKRLNDLHLKQLEKDKENEGYHDFTEGHLYDNVNNDK